MREPSGRFYGASVAICNEFKFRANSGRRAKQTLRYTSTLIVRQPDHVSLSVHSSAASRLPRVPALETMHDYPVATNHPS